MQFSSTLTALTAALSLTVGTQAWTQDRDGVWVANNQWHGIREYWVHEACTYRDTDTIHFGGDECAYFTDNQGNIHHGRCLWRDNQMACA